MVYFSLGEESYVSASGVFMTSVVVYTYSKNYRMPSLVNRCLDKWNIHTVLFSASENMQTKEQNLLFLKKCKGVMQLPIHHGKYVLASKLAHGFDFLQFGLNFIYILQAHDYSVERETRQRLKNV